MTVVEAAILGLVQGVTEFLPISSTAHLRIVPALAGWPDPGAALTAVLQLGTLAAVIGYFLPDFLRMLRAAGAAIGDPARRSDPETKRLVQIVVGTVPIGACGLAFRHAVEGPLRSLHVIAGALIVVGVALFLIERQARHDRAFEDIGMRDAILIGLAQALALVPGVSRSGITLLAAMALGLRRDASARFSFLLSVPAIGAAGVFELPKVLRSDLPVSSLAVGLAVSAVSGYLAIAWLLRFLRTRTTLPFVAYRVLLGIGLLAAVV